VFVAAAFAGGLFIDARGGVAGALAVVVRTTVVAAGALALDGGFVLLASLRRRVRPRSRAKAAAGAAAAARTLPSARP
jgi:hypothetical protein